MPFRVLIADDHEANRELLRRVLAGPEITFVLAANGSDALEQARRQPFDLILLDLVMPHMDGIQVLTALKSDTALRDIPVLMISATDDMRAVVRCIEMGAEDFISKPFDSVLLNARVGASLERKRLRDTEKQRTTQLEQALQEARRQRNVSEALLLNILPPAIATELSAGGAVEPRQHDDVSILFTDFVNFSALAETLTPRELVNLLHDCFSAFDTIVARYGLDRLKTIGDSYMCVGGFWRDSAEHAIRAALAGSEIVEFVARHQECNRRGITVRVGVHTGPVIAGVVGTQKFAFDIWGDAVNHAWRMQLASESNRVTVSPATFSRISSFFQATLRKDVLAKGDKYFDMYLLEGIRPELSYRDFIQLYETTYGSSLNGIPPYLWRDALRASA